ncbi:MAG: hypothetical protein J6R79_03820 [Bacteroidaceae bacterium]|nr:hypothetical protein [Bacteroidaceae bacterium]
MNRENSSIVSALVLLASGVVLAYLSFFTSADGEISNSVLWYFAQTLVYAGSVFGLKLYIDYALEKRSQ